MCFMTGSVELIMIFISLEISSISTYVLAGFRRSAPRATESSIKYLLLGSFAAGFLLYGIALVYGTTASTNLGCVAEAIGQRSAFAAAGCPAAAPAAVPAGGRIPPMLLAGMGFLIVGLGFKAAVAPFHMWTPDVYEGAPTAVTAYMSVAAKAAAFAAFLRVFLIAFPSLVGDWRGMVAVIAALTMIIGNTVAIAQQNIKRMLAYSSIAHAGYILVAVVSANPLGAQSVLFYTLAYTLMNLGAFAVVILLGRRGEENVLLADYAGLGYRQPLLAALMALFMLSLAGIPPTAGFWGKFYVFTAVWQAGYQWLAVIAVITSAIAAFFYLRIVVQMFMSEPVRETPTIADRGLTLGIGLSALGILIFGIIPTPVIEVVRQSVLALGR
jgi:NADH-quinone oxidoreductase subunit N